MQSMPSHCRCRGDRMSPRRSPEPSALASKNARPAPVEDGVLKPVGSAGRAGGAAEVLASGCSSTTPGLRRDRPAREGASTLFCLVHCFHDATLMGDGTSGLTRSRLAPIQLAGRGIRERLCRGSSATAPRFPVRVPPDSACGHRDDVTGMMPVKRVRHRGGRVIGAPSTAVDHVVRWRCRDLPPERS